MVKFMCQYSGGNMDVEIGPSHGGGSVEVVLIVHGGMEAHQIDSEGRGLPSRSARLAYSPFLCSPRRPLCVTYICLHVDGSAGLNQKSQGVEYQASGFLLEKMGRLVMTKAQWGHVPCGPPQ